MASEVGDVPQGPGLGSRLVGEFLLTVLVPQQARIDGDDDLPANQHARLEAEAETEKQNQGQGMTNSSTGRAAGVMSPPMVLLGSGT